MWILILWLSSCWNKEKKQEVVKKNEITQKQEIKNEDNQKYVSEDFKLSKFNKDITKISFIELNNSLYSNWWGKDLYKKIELLNRTWSSIENKMKATFLESFIWDYKKAIQSRKDLCKNNLKSDFCKKIDLNLISYRPEDLSWNILNNVNIFIDWEKIGKLKWKNNIEVINKFVHRIRITKEGYLDFYKKVFIDTNNIEDDSLNPKLLKANLEKIVASNKLENIKTNNFDFQILPHSFKTIWWKIYTWKVKLYIFDIGEKDWDLNVLNLDAFWINWDYLWNSMVTFWMPLIKAYDENWNELNISRLITWKWKIQNLKKAPGIDLVNVPKNKWLTKKDLDKYNIPSFWYLDQKNWIWKETTMKILDSDWNYEFNLK